LNLRAVIRFLKLRENLGAVDNAAFLDENGFHAAAQFPRRQPGRPGKNRLPALMGKFTKSEQ
jgi:hypothetical protein